MPVFIRDTGSPLTPLKHSQKIFQEYLTTNFFTSMLGGRADGSPIVLDTKNFAGKEAGDSARYHFVPLTADEIGIEGQNATITGNEQSVDEYYMDLRIDQVAQGFVKKGKMTDKRTIWNFRDQCVNRQLPEFFRRRFERDISLSLSGFNTDGCTYIDPNSAAGLERDAVNGDHRCFRVDYDGSKYVVVEVSSANSDANSLLGSMSTSDIMNTAILDELAMYAKLADSKYAMRPYRTVNGKEYYCLVLHPKAAIALRRDPAWKERAVAGMTGTKDIEGDPIATGVMGIWENIILKEAEKIVTHQSGGLTIARNLLLGAEAAVVAWGQKIEFAEQRNDYGRILGYAADEIRGMNKFCWDNTDLNIAQVPCAI